VRLQDHGLNMVWPAYCSQQQPWAVFLKHLLTGFLPALLLNIWQNMVMPRAVYYLVQVGGLSLLSPCLAAAGSHHSRQPCCGLC
jgi:hypothetical protein